MRTRTQCGEDRNLVCYGQELSVVRMRIRANKVTKPDTLLSALLPSPITTPGQSNTEHPAHRLWSQDSTAYQALRSPVERSGWL
jgi:hypothetical protein